MTIVSMEDRAIQRLARASHSVLGVKDENASRQLGMNDSRGSSETGVYFTLRLD